MHRVIAGERKPRDDRRRTVGAVRRRSPAARSARCVALFGVDGAAVERDAGAAWPLVARRAEARDDVGPAVAGVSRSATMKPPGGPLSPPKYWPLHVFT